VHFEVLEVLGHQGKEESDHGEALDLEFLQLRGLPSVELGIERVRVEVQ
jgi:hypothetical protein